MPTPLVVDLGDPEFWQDPYPTFARAQHRIARSDEAVMLLRADDLDLVHTDPAFAQPGLRARTSRRARQPHFYEWRRLTMPAHDDPVHERLRGTVVRAFTPRRVEPLRAELYEHACAVLVELRTHEQFDVVADYANDLPLWLICRFLGLPVDARTEIATFLAGTEAGFVDPLTPERRRVAEDGIVALYTYVEGLVDERVADPRDDIVSDLLEAEAEGRLSRAELLALVVNVLGGAIGSSRAAIANTILLLLAHPEQTAWVRADPDARLNPAIEECLRFHPPFRTGRKLVVHDNDTFGVPLVAGDTVFLARQAANRDPQRWRDPDRFDVTRAPERHFSFGYGPHFCLGQALARLDVQEAVRAFLAVMMDELPGARLLTVDPRRVPFTPDEQLEELLVRS
ncbi:MAG: cytochrome P450 [Acidimicrobiia bacterium]